MECQTVTCSGAAMERRFYGCYLLNSVNFRRSTYIGFTVNPARRIRQHNGEICSGAFRTKKKRPWEMVMCIYGFPSQVKALKFEWAWQHPKKSKHVRGEVEKLKGLSGVNGKIKIAFAMLSLRKWRRMNLTVHFFSSRYASDRKGCHPLPDHMRLDIGSLDQLPSHAYSFEDEVQEEHTDSDMSDSSSSDDDPCSPERLVSSSRMLDAGTEDVCEGQAEPVNVKKTKKSRKAGSDPKTGKETLGSSEEQVEQATKRKRKLRKIGKDLDDGLEKKKSRASCRRTKKSKKARQTSKKPNARKSKEASSGSSLCSTDLHAAVNNSSGKEDSEEQRMNQYSRFTAVSSSLDQETGLDHETGARSKEVFPCMRTMVSSSLITTPKPMQPQLVQIHSPYLISSSSPPSSLLPSISFLTPCRSFPAIAEEEEWAGKPAPGSLMSIILISSTPVRELIDLTESPQ